jgi:hypothetical protein
MIKKSVLLTALACVLLLVVIGANAVYTVKAYAPVKEVIWDKPENKLSIAHVELFGPLERPQVIFDHKKHAEALKKEGKKEGETCDTCHPLDKEKNLILFDFPKKVKKKDKDLVRNAYHGECISCHKEKLREKKKSGPVICGDCHKKEYGSITVKYPIIEFDFYYHDKHVKKLKEKIGKDACSLCHHTYDIDEEDETLALVYEEGTEDSCYYCHDLEKKRGPKLTAITRVTSKKGLNVQRSSHLRCLNCHLEYEKELESKKEKKKDKKAGPTECAKCHTGKYKTIAELEKVPRPDRGQKEKPFINIENAKMKGVAFDHKFHEKNHKTCRGCHHETLNSCKTCHTLTGSSDGKWVNIANAYHDVFSVRSCAGCHNTKKSAKDCAGCHFSIRPMDLETMGPKKEGCSRCHTGKKEVIPHTGKEKEMEIKVLGKETCHLCHTGRKEVIPHTGNCLRCHTGNPHTAKEMDIKVLGKETCHLCHTGRKEVIPHTGNCLRCHTGDPHTAKEMDIKVLEKEYKPAKFPHLKIIEKLVKISNDSKLATYFHAKTSICDGCHHRSRIEAEAKKDIPPYCRNCHTISFDPLHLNRPRLLAAYHRQCIGCHKKMELEKPKECKECHKEKAVRPVDILSKPEGYNKNLLKQGG